LLTWCDRYWLAVDQNFACTAATTKRAKSTTTTTTDNCNID
jgi:hypothetical protein